MYSISLLTICFSEILTKENLLFLSHRIPYPPNKGDKLRSFHLLEHLKQSHVVHMGTFVDDREDWKHAQSAKQLGLGSVHYAPIKPLMARVGSLTGLASGEALSVSYYRNRALRNWVNETVARHNIRKVVAFSSPMAQYVRHLKEVTRLIDFVDLDSDKWIQYAKQASWPMRWIYNREGRALLDFERRIAHEFDASFFVSKPEADLFSKKTGLEDKVHFFRNGVNSETFDPAQAMRNPYTSSRPKIVFTGAMDSLPNIDAVTWFSREVFPILKARGSDAEFYIVGSNPSQSVKNLETGDIHVTGRVERVQPYIAYADLVVAPLRMARGVQNKILEALSMEKPVVASKQAIAGIECPTPTAVGCLCATTATDFAHKVGAVLSSPFRNQAGRQWVLAHYNWQRNLSRLDAFL